MLAQSFKAAEDLGLTDLQYDALRQTLVAMETGLVEHVKVDQMKTRRAGTVRGVIGKFNMAFWRANMRCGTVACLGGTAEMISGTKPGTLFGSLTSPALHELFHPSGGFEWENISVDQAARALRNYLTTGEPNWEEAL